MSLTRCYIVLAYWPTCELDDKVAVPSVCFSICAKRIISQADTFLKKKKVLLASFSPFFIFLTPFPPSSGSPAELCQLRVDDEIVAVNGVAVAHMNYSQWKDKITSSLQTGSLTMDIRRYGNKGEMSQKKTCPISCLLLQLFVIIEPLTSNQWSQSLVCSVVLVLMTGCFH